MISAKVNSEINFPFKVRSGTGIFLLKEFRHVIFPILATSYWLMLL